MRAVAQRVSSAEVRVDGERVSTMDKGLLAFVGVGREDDARQADELARRLVHLRIFNDDAGRMNHSLLEVGGTLGVVSQFTLFGDARQGRRPSYNAAARPEHAEPLLGALRELVTRAGVTVVTGRFGAHMNVELVNDGPVTLLLDTDRNF